MNALLALTASSALADKMVPTQYGPNPIADPSLIAKSQRPSQRTIPILSKNGGTTGSVTKTATEEA